MSRPRDFNKKKIEKAIADTTSHFTQARIGGNYATCLAPLAIWQDHAKAELIRKILKSAWWKRRTDIQLSQRGIDHVALNSTTGIDVVHQLAHHMSDTACHGFHHSGYQPHGVEFVQAWLELVEWRFGKDVKRQLKKDLVANKVRTYKKSDEARAKQSEDWYKHHVPQAKDSLVDIMAQLEAL